MKPLIFLFLSSLFVSAAIIEEFSRQPYVQLATDNSMNIVWRSRTDMKPRVVFGTTIDHLSSEVPAEKIITRKHPSIDKVNPIFKDAPVDTRQFEA
ncbi:MAG TPA: hypothetical protein DDY45_05255, partial [Verrucomicrobiales bacterium]|nr:hypothetical protein [Verrucomicrobiales bacterium]